MNRDVDLARRALRCDPCLDAVQCEPRRLHRIEGEPGRDRGLGSASGEPPVLDASASHGIPTDREVLYSRPTAQVEALQVPAHRTRGHETSAHRVAAHARNGVDFEHWSRTTGCGA